MKKPIAPEAIPTELELLALYDKQIETAKKMVEALQFRRRALREFIHANVIGDQKAFDVLRPMLDKCPTRAYYENQMVVDMTIRRLKEKQDGQDQ